MDTIKVTFKKEYEIDKSQIVGLLQDEGYEDTEITDYLIKEKAESVTRGWLVKNINTPCIEGQTSLFDVIREEI